MRFIVSRCARDVREPFERRGEREGVGAAKDVTRRYTAAGIVFLHSDGDHVTVCHFRRNYLCPALRAATRRDADASTPRPDQSRFPLRKGSH